MNLYYLSIFCFILICKMCFFIPHPQSNSSFSPLLPTSPMGVPSLLSPFVLVFPPPVVPLIFVLLESLK